MNSLSDDPEIYNIIKKEERRQRDGIELIASENFTSKAVMEANGSCLTNKYSEGYPGRRYYGGTKYVDQLELLCQDRALSTFRLNSAVWGVNVQSLSGSPANFQVLTGLLNPHDRIMGLDLPSGGHLSHGYRVKNKKISAPAIYFESLGYRVDSSTGLLNYDKIQDDVDRFMPKLIIVGGSAYPRDWDYQKFRKIADDIGAYLMADIAHISGLVLTGEHNNPFIYCDVVTTTTHKTLRGPRGGLIFYKLEYKERIDSAVFPGCQGGPHNNVIAGIAVALNESTTKEFVSYIKQVKRNAKVLADELMRRGYKLVTDGTDNHLILWDLRPVGLTGSKMEKICDFCHITLNKNTVYGDKSALTPGGVRIGTPAMTTRGFRESEMIRLAHYLNRLVEIGLEIQIKSGKKLVDFKQGLISYDELRRIKSEIKEWSRDYYLPG